MSTSYPVSTIAKLFDLTERRVQQLAKEGIIPKANKNMYEIVPSVQNYIKYLRRERPEDATLNNASTHRARLIKIKADKLEMEMKVAKGKLLDAEKAEAGWDNLIARCRAGILAIPSRLALQVSMTAPKEAEQLMKEALHEALLELSTTPNIGDKIDDDIKQSKELSSQISI